MHRRLRHCAVAAAVVLTPLAAFAQATASHPDDALPFGQWTIVDGHVDESAIVWSRCRGANGQDGRWIATKPNEVVHPTYIVQREPLRRTPAAPQNTLGGLVECVGSDGSPGTLDPAPPARSVLPLGAMLEYGTVAVVQYQDSAARSGHTNSFVLHAGDSAVDDGSGPVIVTARQIAVFPRLYSLSIKDSANENFTVHIPGRTLAAPPTSCSVVVFDRQSVRRVVATENGSCTALSAEERQRAIRDARAQLATAPG